MPVEALAHTSGATMLGQLLQVRFLRRIVVGRGHPAGKGVALREGMLERAPPALALRGGADACEGQWLLVALQVLERRVYKVLTGPGSQCWRARRRHQRLCGAELRRLRVERLASAFLQLALHVVSAWTWVTAGRHKDALRGASVEVRAGRSVCDRRVHRRMPLVSVVARRQCVFVVGAVPRRVDLAPARVALLLQVPQRREGGRGLVQENRRRLALHFVLPGDL
mmetsp:Transcript_134788/g.430743  ORF Transcript_134788/g.430743 Transcript_134788/m.430743 type:complete len:225 (+) Transcript_134788:1073-1747(+)